MRSMDALDKAIRIVGSQKALGEACGVWQTAVSQWRSRGSVPAEYCASIERATKGAVMRWDLRPEDWRVIWPELARKRNAPREALHA